MALAVQMLVDFLLKRQGPAEVAAAQSNGDTPTDPVERTWSRVNLSFSPLVVARSP